MARDSLYSSRREVRNGRKRAAAIFFEQKTVLPYQLSKNENKVSLKLEKKEKEKGGLFFLLFLSGGNDSPFLAPLPPPLSNQEKNLIDPISS